MLTNPKLMLPFQIARICKTISNVRCDLRGGLVCSGERRLLACRVRQLAERNHKTRFRQAAGNDRLAACAPQMKLHLSRGFELYAPTRIAKRITINFCFRDRLQRPSRFRIGIGTSAHHVAR